MGMRTVKLGGVSVSRMIIGGNPFSGFSHQGPRRDKEMLHYYTAARIKEMLRRAESAGINTLLGRADNHVIRVLTEYRDEGGSIQWIAQTCPEFGSTPPNVGWGLAGGAMATYIHGGTMDYLLANDKLDILPDVVDQVRAVGAPVGVAGHNPEVFRWAEANLDVDFYMCSYYNPSSRADNAMHVDGTPEWFDPADRDIMVELIATLSKPAIHYKVLAAGRNDPADALRFVADHLRDQDAVCIGYYLKDHPDSIEQNLQLLGMA